jgi:hypothetical protein
LGKEIDWRDSHLHLRRWLVCYQEASFSLVGILLLHQLYFTLVQPKTVSLFHYL